MRDEPKEDTREMVSELSSWKRIADYLNVTPRTAQKWEKELELPVKRFGGQKGRVSVSVEDLENWKKAHIVEKKEKPFPSVRPQATPDQKLQDDHPLGIESSPAQISNTKLFFLRTSNRKLGQYLFILLSPVFLFLIATSGFFITNQAPSQPAESRVEGKTLHILDASGKLLWSKVFSEGLLPASSTASFAPACTWFGDLDGDTQTEVLFAKIPFDRFNLSSELLCFSAHGTLKWSFTLGQEVATRKENFNSAFIFRNLLVTTLERGGDNYIVVVSSHNDWYPCQIALLSNSGKCLKQYWHDGHIGIEQGLAATDLDGDGEKEILLGGINNARKQATLVVLDKDHFAGAAQEINRDYQLLNFPPAVERARLIFPRSCLSKVLAPFNKAGFFSLKKDGLELQVVENNYSSNIITNFYELSNTLDVTSFKFGGLFIREHQIQEQSGQIAHHQVNFKNCFISPEVVYLTPFLPGQTRAFLR
jgi:hypothetical protein